MEIQLHDIPPEGLELDFEQTQAGLGLSDEGLAFEAPLQVHLSVMKDKEGVFVTGHLQGRLALECVCCLKAASFPLSTGLQAHYLSSDSLSEQEEHELRREEMDIIFYSGPTLDFDDLLREQVLLSVPMHPLCNPDCRGLCPQCGQNLNTAACGCEQDILDPRFSVLKDYFKKDYLK